jgi:NodT family efflux transporter outer membrane factor (OMF) lipoprotein
VLVGCGTQPATPLPPMPVSAWRQAPADARLPAPDLRAWWRAFDDPVLDALVDSALRDNLGLAQATGRLRAARVLAERERRAYRPTLSGVVQTLQDVAAIDSYFHVGLEATWELGLFGARESLERGGQARLDLAAATAQGVRVATVAEVVRRYLELAAACRDARGFERLIDLDTRLIALHEVRRQQHLDAREDRHALVARRAQAQGQWLAARATIAQAEQALAILLGRAAPDPAWRSERDEVPAPADFRVAQLPADLLVHRPDVRAAEAEVLKATSELGLARAELYPRVVLGLSFLYAYNITQNRRNVDNTVPSVGPSIDLPIFDWGRRRAAADARAEALDTALLAYRQALLDGVGDTESALALVGLSRERDALSQAAWGDARQQQAQQATRQRLGLASEVEALEAARRVEQAALERSAARVARGQAMVMLYRALGGAPVEPATSPVGSTDRSEAMPVASASPERRP